MSATQATRRWRVVVTLLVYVTRAWCLRTLNYDQMLAHGAVSFRLAGVDKFGPIFLDVDGSQAIVGAQDTLMRISFDKNTVLERVDVAATEDKVKRCEMYGRPPQLCRNFVRVLAPEGKERKILTCGTDAFRPSCTVRSMDKLSDVHLTLDGIGFVPYDPSYNFTYVADSEGHFFAGVALDLISRDSAIVRIRPSSSVLRTYRNSVQWLNEPRFVAMFEVGPYVYVFFSEVALEDDGYHATGADGGVKHRQETYSRISRVCKNDPGTRPLVDDMWWTTFRKARLVCQNEDGVLFDQVQSVDFVAAENLFYATFTCTSQHIMGSAVCAYSLDSVEGAFRGSFKVSGPGRSCWTDKPNADKNVECTVEKPSADNIDDLLSGQKYQLMTSAVLPIFNGALHFSALRRYSKLLVDVVETKDAGAVRVLFIVDADGLLRKFVHVATSKLLCPVEVVHLANGSHFAPGDFKLDSGRGWLFVSAGDELLQVPVSRCGLYETMAQCLGSNDPYCAWDRRAVKCALMDASRLSDPAWSQKIGQCSLKNSSVDGAYGPWTEWTVCPRNDDGQNCMCRSRLCDSPAPRLGGQPCQGASAQVTNCTVHGKWTSWDQWSGCSASCGLATRTRRRFCGNPAPSHDGRACLGSRVEKEYCDVPACPTPAPFVQNGHWSPWSPWRPCTKRCGGGFKRRSRLCNNPPPASGGHLCSGADDEYQTCNEHPCDQFHRSSEWTTWTKVDELTLGAVVLHRHRLSCSAPVAKEGDLLMHPLTVDEKVCVKGSANCSQLLSGAKQSSSVQWSAWSDWSDCTKSCGRGVQSRERLCLTRSHEERTNCTGSNREIRLCNRHPCLGEAAGVAHLGNFAQDASQSWSCWSDYSECSSTCGSGVRKRWRVCNGNGEQCSGANEQVVDCNSASCEGDPGWSAWSKCTPLGLRTRIRLCAERTVCQEPTEAQLVRCSLEEDDEESSEAGGNALKISHPRQGDDPVLLIVAVVGSLILVVLFFLALLCTAKLYPSLWCFSCFNKSVRCVPCPPTPMVATKCNIYTPPPLVRNGRSATPNLIMNPLNKYSGKDDELFEGLNEEEAALTLKRNMLTSLNTKDYL